MRGILIYLFALGFFFLSSPAGGEEWKFLGTHTDGSLVFVETGSIKHISKTIVRAWVKLSLKKPKQFKSKHIIMMMDYLENDCSNDKYRYIEISHYYTDGTKNNNNMELIKIWSYVTTDTIQSLVNDYLCRGK